MASYSLLVPTWNNLPYLKLCVESLRRHSAREHQLLVHANEGSDGTRAWLRGEGIEHTASDANVGICHAVNLLGARARGDYVVYLNDDMVLAPGWDTALDRAIERCRRHGAFMLSGTMVEPVDTGNVCAVHADLGRDPANFDLARFAREAPGLARADWLGATWPPTLVSRELWHQVGGYSVEFSPGMGSDNDFSRKLWQAGCRVFLGVGASLVYHFSETSTRRIRKNDGRRQFLMKWGMTQSGFDRHYLRRGQPAGADPVLPDPPPSFGLRWQSIKAALRRRLF
ncbi:MAG TPA: glycosyltransferase [Burkholderiales bacterium]|nr:glycosyltransferase [Burkholderiales bacterium]